MYHLRNDLNWDEANTLLSVTNTSGYRAQALALAYRCPAVESSPQAVTLLCSRLRLTPVGEPHAA